LTIAKNINTTINYAPGQTVSYTIDYCNNENSDINDVTIIDTYDPGMTFISSSLTGYTHDSNSKTIRRDGINLLANECTTASIDFQIPSNYNGLTLDNHVKIGTTNA
jgi:uncharacterized repeat protein (TIGR01451 family)